MVLLPAASGPYTTKLGGLGKRGCLSLAQLVPYVQVWLRTESTARNCLS